MYAKCEKWCDKKEEVGWRSKTDVSITIFDKFTVKMNFGQPLIEILDTV